MSNSRQPVIVGAARTPVGRLLGALASKSASELGGAAIAAALERAGVAPDRVQYTIMGQVLQAGAGQITARQAAVAAGIPMTIPALTVNKVCLSGLDAIALASQLIRLGEHDVVVAGGMESMTRAPHLLVNSRAGYKYGPVTVEDSMALDGLTDAFDHLSMGESTERSGRKLGITREQQDEFAAMSHQRAAEATKNGLFTAEIVGIPIPQRGGEQLTVTEDEGIRPGTTVETLAKLRPAFGQDGTITAGTASQISDGAAAVVVTSAEYAERAGLNVIAEIGAHGNVAGPDNSLQSQPSNAIKQALAKAGLTVSDLDLIEINEAFAMVAIQSMRDLGVGPDVVNVNGGAIAIGHPIGASGARLAVHLCYELGRRGGGLGAAGRARRCCSGCTASRPVPEISTADTLEAARAGDTRALARLLSLVEDESPRVRSVIRDLVPATGGARVIGLTGAPGVGKSTVTSALVGAYRAAGSRVAVLAVDPSSPFTGGALLGDRIRMQAHATDDRVFIRSMANRGQLGGLAAATPQAIRVLDAVGFDLILVETVGVGQDEVDIASLADSVVVLLAPGMGDAIQAAKAGILEVADLFVVNKADKPDAQLVVRDLRNMIALADLAEGDWKPPIVTSVAVKNEGIQELVHRLNQHWSWLNGAGELKHRRLARAREELTALAFAALRGRLAASRLDELAGQVADGTLDPFQAADELLNQ